MTLTLVLLSEEFVHEEQPGRQVMFGAAAIFVMMFALGYNLSAQARGAAPIA